MNVEQRKQYINDLYAENPGWNFAGWFDAILGVISFAQDVHELPDSRFFSATDAGILQSYAEGMALAKGLRTSSDNTSASKWSDFVKFRYKYGLDPGADAASMDLWGAAEQASTDFGRRWAENNQGLRASVAEQVYLALGDQFRTAVHFNVPGFDPRSAGVAYALSSAAWQAGLAQEAESGILSPIGWGWMPLPK